MKRVLVVAAHPDDELLGVGGTAARHASQGGRGHVSHHVRGESLRYKKDMGQKTAVSQAGEILGVKEIRQIGFPDQRLDTVTLTEIITPLEKISDEFKPNIVYCQYGGDINMDHQLLFQAANVAFRPLDGWIEDVYAFYTASSTEWGFPRTFTPDTWIDITDTLEKKDRGIPELSQRGESVPASQVCESVGACGTLLGNQCSMEAAEAFMTVRSVKR